MGIVLLPLVISHYPPVNTTHSEKNTQRIITCIYVKAPCLLEIMMILEGQIIGYWVASCNEYYPYNQCDEPEANRNKHGGGAIHLPDRVARQLPIGRAMRPRIM